jgi:hypothetical protein
MKMTPSNERLVRWIAFTVLISIAPILFNFLGRLFDGKPVGIQILLGGGELLLIACSLAAAGIGEIVGRRVKSGTPIAAGGGCFLIAMTSSFSFAYLQHGDKHNTVLAAYFSLVLFVLTVVAATMCIMLPYTRR